jgi:hypothetical protein
MPSYIRTRTEFAVNSFTAGNQAGSSIATFADGGFIVTWVTNDATQDGDGNALKAQFFDSAGRKVGYEFLVNASAAGNQFTPRMATLPDGSFVVTWVTSPTDGGPNQIKAQLFSRSGAPIGGEFQVNATGSSLFEANVTSLADGRFLISWDDWSSQSVKAQIFDSAGGRVGAILNLATTYAQGFGDVVGLANGGFVATWRDGNNSWDVKAQIFSASGAKVGAEFLAHTNVTGSQNDPSALALADGGFVLAWATTGNGAPRIEAQIFTASGQRAGGEIVVNTLSGDWMGGQVLTALPDGGFLIAWHTGVLIAGGGSNSEVKAQRFTAAGVKIDGEFQVNTGTAGSQSSPDLATLVDGRVIAVWRSDTGDIDSGAVRAQILGTELAAPLANTHPAIISNGAGASVTLTQDEGVSAVTRVVASDDGEPNNLRYSITSGDDSALFRINALTGVLEFVNAPDHVEGGDNSYSVTVTASDGQLTDSQQIHITLRHVNYIVIVSDGGYEWAELWVDENQTAVTTVSAVDDDGVALTYSITGGEDASLFTIDPQSGQLSFTVAPDYESPANTYGDNVYYVTVTATDGTRSDSQNLAVYVNDVEEPQGFTITSDGGGDHAQLRVPENGTAVTVVAVSGAAGPVTYEIVGGADAASFTIDPETGELRFEHPHDFESVPPGYPNAFDVVVRASDGTSFDEQHLNVVLEDVDEAPEFYPFWSGPNVAVTIAENTQAVLAVEARDPDRYGWVTYGLEGADAALFEVDPYNGGLSFRQGLDYESPADADGDNVYEVAVIAYSGELSATQSFSITIADEIERVTITSHGGERDVVVEMAENGSAVTVVKASGDSGITYEIVGGRDSDAFVIDPYTGALAFAFPPDFEWAKDLGEDNVYEVTVRAGDGRTYDHQNVSVIVRNVDEAPEFYDYWTYGAYPLSMVENGSYVADVQAYDPDGGPAFTYSITGGADSAFFVIDPQTGALSWVPGGAPDHEAPADADADNLYELDITATQGSWSRTQAFTVAVANENERPKITSDGGGTSAALELDEGQTAVTTVVAADPDGPDPVTYSITGGPDADLFAIDSATGALSFLSAPDYEAPVGESNNFYTVEVTASDGMLTTFQKVQILVRDVEEGVTFTTAAGLSVDEDSAFVAKVTATDGDGDPVIYAIVGGADSAHFAIDPQTGDLTTRTSLDFESPADADGDNVYEVTVRASDGQLSDDRHLSITVQDVDDDVEITSFGGADLVSLTLPEHSLSVADVDANMSAFSGVTFAIGGGADAALFTVDRYSGELKFNYPFAPDFEAPADADRDNVYDVVVVANRLTTSDSQAFAITVSNRNEGLWITSNDRGDATISMNEGEGVVTTVTAFDPDGDIPVYSVLGGADAALFAIDPVTGVLTFVAAPDYEAPHNAAGTNFYLVEVGASDGEFTSRQRLRVEINNLNEGVTITSGGGAASAALTVDENGVAVTTVAARDGDGDPLTYSIVGGADSSRFTIDARTGVLRFVQAPDREVPADAGGDNVYDVVVAASDGSFTDTQALAVTVGNLDEPVTILSAEGITTEENGTAVATIVARDADGGPVTYSITGGPDASRFAIDARTGALSFVQAADFEAPADTGSDNTYELIISASDGNSTASRTFRVLVGNVDEAVAISSNGGGASAAVAVGENGSAVTVVKASDPDGSAVTYAIAGGADGSRFAIDATTGVLTFVAAPNFEAPEDAGADNVYDVVVSASDGTSTDTQSLAVTVGNVNEAVLITSNGGGAKASVSVGENDRAVTTVAATDPEGSAPSYSIVGGADAARFTIDPRTGVLQFVTAPDHESPGDSNGDNVYDVVVQASDGVHADLQTLSVSVVNLRDGNNVTGTTGGDSISGTSTNPALRTSNAEDNVSGRDGHDTILGLGGDDILAGDAGNDVLNGGAGADRLTGGLGKDQFVYNLASESTASARDVITDFSRAQGDKISLSGIDANEAVSGNQAFTFIGSAAFSNVAGQLRYSTSGGVTLVSGDVNGDGVADFQIELTGTLAPIASDFVL